MNADTELWYALDMLGIDWYRALDIHLKINFKASYSSAHYNRILPISYQI